MHSGSSGPAKTMKTRGCQMLDVAKRKKWNSKKKGVSRGHLVTTFSQQFVLKAKGKKTRYIGRMMSERPTRILQCILCLNDFLTALSIIKEPLGN